MIYLSQRDPRWGSIKLGASNIDLYHYGCTTTCISMLSDYFGGRIFPDAIARTVSNYTPDGLILWTKLQFAKMKFDWRGYGRDDKKIQEYLKDPNKAVILQVNDGKHWVVATRRTPPGPGSGHICVDPRTGKQCDVLKVYKNITGAAYFSKK